MLSLQNVSFSVSQFKRSIQVLLDVNLEAYEGEVLVVLGDSGCGKTTLLRLIAGLLTPSEGRIEFNGKAFTNVAPHERQLSLTFQSCNYYDHWNIGQHLKHDLGYKASNDASSILSRVGLGDLAEKYPHELSGGQQQRLAVARALATDRRIMLLDEPIVHLDQTSKRELLNVIVGQKRADRIMIYVTHDADDALVLADRIAILQFGRIAQIGTPEEIYNLPARKSLTNYLAQHPMQFFGGQIDSRGIFVSETTGISCLLPLRKRATDQEDFDPRQVNTSSRAIVVGVRPESIEVGRPNFTSDATDVVRLSGQVAEHRFHAASQVLIIEVCQRAFRLMAVRSSATARDMPLVKGDQVTCEIAIQDFHCFDEASGIRLG